MSIRRVFTIITIFLILFVIIFWYWQRQQSEDALSQKQAAEQQRNDFAIGDVESVIAEGVVVPSRRAVLSFTTGGSIASWLQPEGATVTAGTELAILSSPQLSQSVALAEAELKLSEAHLELAQNGAQPNEIAAAEAAVASAQAHIELAQADLRGTLANLEATEAQTEAATANIDGALAQLQEAELGPSDEEVRSATARLQQAEAGVRQAQAAYDIVAYRNDIAALPESRALEEATHTYELALAEYDRIIKGSTEEQLEQLRANYRRAEAELQQVQMLVDVNKAAVFQALAQLNAATAARDQAQAELDLLNEGTRPEEIAALEAQVEQARAALAQAHALEAQMVLKAPFDGVLVQQLVRTGETVIPQQPVVQFGDHSVLQVETDDLDEIDAALVREGQAVTVRFDALPEVEVPGRVAAVRQVAEDKRGKTTFTVQISLDEVPERLLWGMTATAEIHLR